MTFTVFPSADLMMLRPFASLSSCLPSAEYTFEDALAEGRSFEDVAKEFSDDTGSAANGGSLGFSDADTSYVTEFLEAALKLNQGEISEWVIHDGSASGGYSGYHLIRCDSTSYEDFMLLEYLFRPENLPSTFEYLSNNLYTLLENQIEEVPTSMASNVGPNELIDVFSNPRNLYKTKESNSLWNQRTNGYIPIKINETKHVDTIDVPENRFYKNFLEFIESLIISLINKTEEGYVRDKLYEYKEEISYYLSQRYFKDISIMDYAPLNSQVLQKKEGYRDILEYYLMFEFGFKMNWSDITNDFRGYEKKLSTLYEY